MDTTRGRPLTRSRPRISARASRGRGVGRAENDLYLLGGALPDQQGVLLLDELNDVVVELVASHPDGLAGNDPPERL